MRENNALRDGKAGAAFGVAVNHRGIFNFRKLTLARDSGRCVSKNVCIIKLQNCQIDSGRNSFHGCGDFVSGLVRLNLHPTRIHDHMRIRENALAFNHYFRCRSPL